ncbi:armadillo-type protein, partial [Ochromonadaceae sp. CCMP2298]
MGDIEIKRAAGYLLATICEQSEFHQDLEREGAYETVIALSRMEDVECQEYAAFSLAHLASNRDNQVKLVSMGVVRPLVAMLSSDAEPKHYAGLALLKLADNFENHLKIAEDGGIQALLRLGRSRSTDDQLQYK